MDKRGEVEYSGDMEKILKQLEEKIKGRFSGESSGHDIHHLKRVMNLALSIQEKESGDRLVIGIAALLHDIHRIIQSESGVFCSPKDSLPQVKEMLDSVDLSAEQKSKILHSVEFHDEYGFTQKGNKVVDIETLILQDADNLDAIGAIGIGRTFAYGGSKGLPMWIPEQSFGRRDFDESVNNVSTIHHFYDKLLRLKDNMNTAAGRQMAEHRHAFIESFLKEFFEEWEGEK